MHCWGSLDGFNGIVLYYMIQICCLAAKRCSLPLHRERERERENSKTVFYKERERGGRERERELLENCILQGERERGGERERELNNNKTNFFLKDCS